MEVPREPTDAFFRDELSRALEECGFGISSWEVERASGEPSSSAKPTALGSVWLLSDEAEVGPEMRIELSLQGYRVRGHPGRIFLSCANECLFCLQVIEGLAPQTQTKHYETLDDLLCAVSPVFARRRTKLLFQKLEDVARERSWNNEDELSSEQVP
jgi:hypothetical protein